ncbi:MAG: PAS-domain containing protein [Caulobacteraceae bacterium]|nr:PAS-domain containing protein [Caulobacteraceae bacterium]
MAPADMAYAASAGAIALALSTLVWTWRFRTRAQARARELEVQLADMQSTLSEAEAAASAFEGALIAVEGDEVRLLAGEDALAACARALKSPPEDPAAALQALAALAPEHAAKLKGLIEKGEPFRLSARAEGGPVTVDGRSSGAVAWIRLTPAIEVAPGGRFAEMADRLPAPAWVAGRDGRIIWANKAWLDAAEAESLEDALARDLSFDRNAEAVAAEAIAAGGRREAFRWATVDGKRRAYRLTAEPVGDGDEAGAIAIDVTESEETREQLARHVTAHDETLNHLADAVAIFGPNKRLTYNNKAFEELWGLDPAWLAERPTHSEWLDRLRQRRRLPETAEYAKWKARELEFYGQTEVAPDDLWNLPDGRTLRVVRQPHPMGGILLLFSDITGELGLRAQYNALIQVQQTTLDKLNDAIAVFASDGRLRLHNEAFERLWGATSQQLQDAGDFAGVAALCTPLLHDTNLWAELKGRVTDPDPQSRIAVTGEARTADGRTFSWQSRPLPDGATLIGFGDVTARRELERALVQRSAALSEAETLKREFVGNVSYELRTPLTTILGYAELLQATPGIPDRAQTHVAAVRTAATQLARSIDDVLDMAQIDAGEMALTLGDTRICDVLEAAAERGHFLLKAKNASAIIECEPEVGMIRADERRLSQALDHLIENAARATPENGRITLTAARGQGEVRIEVTDQGRGIPYHQQANVFDRFVARDRGGPGLGLALVKALTELHGGWVELKSEPGQGATFTLHLPERAATGAAAPELDLQPGVATA